MIVAGATAYPRIIDPEPFRAIADEVGALFMFDAAHIAGLIAGGVHPNPVPLRRRRHLHHPQDAARPARRLHPVPRPSYAAAIDKAVFPGLQGGPLEHVIAAKAVAFHEAAAARVQRLRRGRSCANAAALAEALAGAGLPPGVGRHRQPPHARRPAHASTPSSPARRPSLALDRAGITLNKNTVPDDPRPPFVTSGLRIGTPAVTTQGMGEPEMAHDRRADRTGCCADRDDDGERGRGARRGRRPLLEVHALPA